MSDLPSETLPTSQNTPKNPISKSSSQLDPPGLNEKQQAAIELLAVGKSYVLAAKEAGVDRRTLFTWRQDELFQSELRRRHHEVWGDVTERLRMLVDPSVEVLAEHLNDRYDRSRFRAATAILKLANLRNRE